MRERDLMRWEEGGHGGMDCGLDEMGKGGLTLHQTGQARIHSIDLVGHVLVMGLLRLVERSNVGDLGVHGCQAMLGSLFEVR